MTADHDDTSRCPLGVRCECCGVGCDDLAVRTSDLGSFGVACLTMCSGCAGSTVSPPVAIGTAVTLVMQHAAHVGADMDIEELLRKRFHHHDRLTYRLRPAPRFVGPRSPRGGIERPAAQ